MLWLTWTGVPPSSSSSWAVRMADAATSSWVDWAPCLEEGERLGSSFHRALGLFLALSSCCRGGMGWRRAGTVGRARHSSSVLLPAPSSSIPEDSLVLNVPAELPGSVVRYTESVLRLGCKKVVRAFPGIQRWVRNSGRDVCRP